MKDSLFIQSPTRYEIEVNNGSIFIDAGDVEIPKKVDNMYKVFELASKEYDMTSIRIEKSNESEEVKREHMIDAQLTYVTETWRAINSLFGKGASDKIFNSKSVFELELFLEKLPEVLERFGIESQAYFKKRTEIDRSKYAPRESVDEVEEVE